jgi:hypothetical protein
MTQVEDKVADKTRRTPASKASQIEHQGDRLSSAAKFL